VSPDSADPELQNQRSETAETNGNGASAADSSSAAPAEKEAAEVPAANATGNVDRTSTRAWAQSHDYDPKKLFSKLFHDDISYLLSMDKLWTKRRPPTPLDWDKIMAEKADTKTDDAGLIKDQVLWSLAECLGVFAASTAAISAQFKALTSADDHIVWDKDDQNAMDFVTACANIRANIFNIGQKTRFDIKSMAGNIIPAIATTNAIIAGLLVMEGIKVLDGRFSECRSVYLNRRPNPRGRVLVPCRLEKPVPTCYVCSAKNEVNVMLNVETATLGLLNDKILKATFNMVAPDVEVADGKGTVLISSDPDDMDNPATYFLKTLKEMSIRDGTRLNCDDFLQNYTLSINIVHSDAIEEGQEFQIVADAAQLKKIQESASAEEKKEEEDEDDIEMVEAGEVSTPSAKRKPADDLDQPKKKQRLEDDIICV